MRPTTELNWTFCSYQEFSGKMNFQSECNGTVHKLVAEYQFYPLLTESLTDWICQHWSDIPDMLALANNCAFCSGSDLVSASVTTRSNYLSSLCLLKATLYVPWLEYIAFGWVFQLKYQQLGKVKFGSNDCSVPWSIGRHSFLSAFLTKYLLFLLATTAV